MKKKVILHIIESLGIGGAEILLKNTVNDLKEYDHVICYLGGGNRFADDLRNHTVVNLEHHSWINFFRTRRRIRKIIRDKRISVVHAHLLLAVIIARMSVFKSNKFFFTVHSILSDDAFKRNIFSLFIERLTYSKRQTIIGVSEQVIKDYDKHVGIKGPSVVLYNYIDEAYFKINKEMKDRRDGELKLIAVGNLKESKNYKKLLEAFVIVNASYSKISLHIYGAGELENSLQHFIDEKKINVKLMGSSNRLPEIIHQYDAFILASLHEGYGLAPIEAMAAHLPVLLSDLEVFKEIAKDVPHYFNPLSPASIADAIIFCNNFYSSMYSKASLGKDLAKKVASKETYLKKLSALYE